MKEHNMQHFQILLDYSSGFLYKNNFHSLNFNIFINKAVSLGYFFTLCFTTKIYVIVL